MPFLLPIIAENVLSRSTMLQQPATCIFNTFRLLIYYVLELLYYIHLFHRFDSKSKRTQFSSSLFSFASNLKFVNDFFFAGVLKIIKQKKNLFNKIEKGSEREREKERIRFILCLCKLIEDVSSWHGSSKKKE